MCRGKALSVRFFSVEEVKVKAQRTACPTCLSAVAKPQYRTRVHTLLLSPSFSLCYNALNALNARHGEVVGVFPGKDISAEGGHVSATLHLLPGP